MKKLLLILVVFIFMLTACKSDALDDKNVDLDEIKENLYAEFYKEMLSVETGQVFDYEKALKYTNGNLTPVQDLSQPLDYPGEYQFTFILESKKYPEVSKIVEVEIVVKEVTEKSLSPKFEGIKEEFVVNKGGLVNPYKGVIARDYNLDIIPFEVEGSWDTTVEGEYLLVYRAIDAEGNEAEINVLLKVIAENEDTGVVEVTTTTNSGPVVCASGENTSKECDWIPRSAEVASGNFFLFADHTNAFTACSEAGTVYVQQFKENGYKGQFRCISLTNNINEEVGYELWKYKLEDKTGTLIKRFLFF